MMVSLAIALLQAGREKDTAHRPFMQPAASEREPLVTESRLPPVGVDHSHPFDSGKFNSVTFDYSAYFCVRIVVQATRRPLQSARKPCRGSIHARLR
jgi:hypothetical protein